MIGFKKKKSKPRITAIEQFSVFSFELKTEN